MFCFSVQLQQKKMVKRFFYIIKGTVICWGYFVFEIVVNWLVELVN